MNHPAKFPSLARQGASNQSALDRAKAHKAEAASIGRDVGQELVERLADLESFAQQVVDLGDTILPGVRQAAEKALREASVNREQVLSLLNKGLS